MKKILLIVSIVFTLHSSAFGQDKAHAVYNMITSCSECKEVIMISGGVEKKYSGIWLESVNANQGFIEFTKGANTHRWNADRIIFMEETPGYIRFYLEQNR